MKKILFVAAVAAASSTSYAAEFGIGVGFVEGGTIYFPINLANDIRVEPYLGFSTDEWKYRYNNPIQNNNSQKYTETSIGVGVFKILNQSDKLNLYIGGRLGIGSNEWKTSNSNPMLSDSKNKSSGYSISPVVGVEYFVVQNLSWGAEASIVYSNKNEQSTYGHKSSNTRTETGVTIVTIRYYFE
jgi:opacity protein-like surface antigen